MRHIKEGLKHHPGTPIILALIIIGYLAEKWIGLAIMAVIFIPIYIYGAFIIGKVNDNIRKAQGEDYL